MPGLYLKQQNFVEDKRDEQRGQEMIETDVYHISLKQNPRSSKP